MGALALPGAHAWHRFFGELWEQVAQCSPSVPLHTLEPSTQQFGSAQVVHCSAVLLHTAQVESSSEHAVPPLSQQ